MAHFAQVVDNVVVQVIVAEQDFINSGALGNPNNWIQTSYNTRGGLHYGADGNPDGGVALRKNYAGIGYSYDAQRDAFIPPRPFDSWVINEDSCLWEAPMPMPTDGKLYRWDEESVSWAEYVTEAAQE